MYLNDSDLKSAVILVAVICVGIGALLAFGIPALWEFVKPFIHEATR